MYKGGFRGGGGCGVATAPKHLNFEINLTFTFCYALQGENSSRRHFESFHSTTSEAHLPDFGVGGLTLVDFSLL